MAWSNASIKAAIRCHEKKGWAECLPLVLLGFHSVKPVQPQNHGKRPTLVFQPFPSCSYVFVRLDAIISSLQSPYEGPYRVIERFLKNTIRLISKEKA